LRVFHDSSAVFGIECIFEADGIDISGGIHSAPCHPGVVNQVVPLPPGTHITGIQAAGHKYIEQLTVNLSDGLTYKFGGHSHGTHFQISVPHGKHVYAFAGGFGTHLHKLSFSS